MLIVTKRQASSPQGFEFEGEVFRPKADSHWKTTIEGLGRLANKGRIIKAGKTLRYKRFADDFEYVPIDDRWESMQLGRERDYVVQTAPSVVERCILMSSPANTILDNQQGFGRVNLDRSLKGPLATIEGSGLKTGQKSTFTVNLPAANNVEVVQVAKAKKGAWTVDVVASNVSSGPQDFALAAVLV